VITQGQVTELANHDDLLHLNGSYARLWQQQSEFSGGEIK
jgi:ATP-binding cassette subfamily B protein RtxB